MAHPDFGRSVHPFQPGGTDYAHLITTGTPGFSDPPTALYLDENMGRVGVKSDTVHIAKVYYIVGNRKYDF